MPEVRVLKPGDEPTLEAFLKPRLASSMFLISGSRAFGLDDRNARGHASYAGAFVNGELVGVAAFSWTGTVLVQSPLEHLEAVVRTAIDEGKRRHDRGVRTIIGLMDQVDAVEAILNFPTGEAVQIDERETLYELALDKLVLPEPLKSGQMKARPIEICDADVVAAWTLAYRIEAVHDADTPQLRQEIHDGVMERCGSHQTWVLEAEADDHFGPVAISSFNAAIDEAVQIGGVYTPPELRGRGFARAVVAAMLRHAHGQGVSQSILFTGMDNTPARRAYESLGYQPIDRFRLLRLRAPLP